jgi:hypothetical protein
VTDYSPPAEQQRLLAKVDILKQLPPEEVEHLALRSTSVRLGTGDDLTRTFGRLRTAGAVKIKDRHIYATDVDALERLA